MVKPWIPQFLFAACQRGAEPALKEEVASSGLCARLAFSQPGFVTFKLDEPTRKPEQFQWHLTFARTVGFGLGKVLGSSLQQLAELVWQLPEVAEFLEHHVPVDVHVWQRDQQKPGQRGFEPGPTALAAEVDRALCLCSPVEALRKLPPYPRLPSRQNRWVLDAVLVEPNQWWIGCHRTRRRFDCWPGGVMPLELPEYAASRAYLKMQEALEWSALPVAEGELCIELGCAPGGAAQALLDRGLLVLGIDPAEVDVQVLEHPNFEHLRRRTLEVPRRKLRGAKWLMADMNVAPNYTLDAVEEIVLREDLSIRGMVLTLKIAEWSLVSEIPRFIERIRSWGYHDIRTKQLAFNRQEICVAAMRSRGQRRLRRGHIRRRTDPAHRNPSPPHFH